MNIKRVLFGLQHRYGKKVRKNICMYLVLELKNSRKNEGFHQLYNIRFYNPQNVHSYFQL